MNQSRNKETSPLIEAGSGKIKKKRKNKPVKTFTSGDRMMRNPYEIGSEYPIRLKKVQKSDEVFFGSIDNKFYFNHLIEQNIWLFNLEIIEKLFDASKYKKVKHDDNPTYYFCNIPAFPNIEFASLYMPTIRDADEKPHDSWDESRKRKEKFYFKTPDLAKLWYVIGGGSFTPHLQIYFETSPKSKTRKGLYVPMIQGDSKTPEESDDYRWNIFTLKFYKKPKKFEIYNYASCSNTFDQPAEPGCVSRKCLEKALIQGIKEDGGIR